MTDELREAYYQTFRTTDARCKVEYESLENILDAAGFTDEFCEKFMADVKVWSDKIQSKIDAAKKLCEGKSEEEQAAIMQPLVDEVQSTRPKIPDNMVIVFQTNFLNEIKSDADLLLLNTL